MATQVHLNKPIGKTTISFGLTRTKWSCVIMHTAMFDENSNASYQLLSVMILSCLENMKPSVQQLKLNPNWVMQQESNPKHISNSTPE